MENETRENGQNMGSLKTPTAKRPLPATVLRSSRQTTDTSAAILRLKWELFHFSIQRAPVRGLHRHRVGVTAV